MTETSNTYFIAENAGFKIKLAAVVFSLVPVLPLLVGLALGNWLVVAGGVIAGLLLTPLFVWLFRQWSRSKLIVGSGGLLFHRVLGKHPVRIPWESIVKLHIQPGRFGVVLDHPLDNPIVKQLAQANRVHLKKADKSGPKDSSPQLTMAEQRWLPFDYFADWLWHGDLLEKLQQYSPHLAEECRASLAKYPNIGSSRPRWFLLIGVLIGLMGFIAAGLWVSTLIIPSGYVNAWAQFVFLQVAFALFGLILSAMVPILGYFAYTSIRNAWESIQSNDWGEAVFSTALALAQAGFAGWIGIALVSAVVRPRDSRDSTGPSETQPANDTVVPPKLPVTPVDLFD